MALVAIVLFSGCTEATSRPTPVQPTPAVDICIRFPSVCVPATPKPCPSGDLEGCYLYNEMSQFLDLEAEELARSFFNFVFSAGPPRWPVTRFVGATEQLEIGCIGGADTETYAYCPGDETVYIGHDALWLLYDEAGDAAAVAGYVHELGHHLQKIASVPPQAGDNALTIRRENQADCVAVRSSAGPTETAS